MAVRRSPGQEPADGDGVVRGGHVRVNGNAAKPSTRIHPGDRVDALIAGRERIVEVVRPIDARVALMRYLAQGGPMYASRIAAVELRRAVRRQDDRAADEQAELVLEAVRLIEFDGDMARAAGELPPPSLRTLDALHVAAALALGDECGAFVSYDTRLNDAAKQAGLTVQSPTR
jgi:uncharacterized protein